MPQLKFLILKSRLQNFYRFCFKVCVSRWQQITRVLLVAASAVGLWMLQAASPPLTVVFQRDSSLHKSFYSHEVFSRDLCWEQKFLPLHAMQSSVGMIYSWAQECAVQAVIKVAKHVIFSNVAEIINWNQEIKQRGNSSVFNTNLVGIMMCCSLCSKQTNKQSVHNKVQINWHCCAIFEEWPTRRQSFCPIIWF